MYKDVQTYRCGYNTVAVNTATGALTAVKGQTNIAVWYDYPLKANNQMEYDYISNTYRQPSITFSNNTVNITTSNKYKYFPLFSYRLMNLNASFDTIGGGDYVLIHHGAYGAAPSTLQLTTISSAGEETTVNEWFEDDNNLLIGFWKAQDKERIYGITVKPGTYSLDPLEWQKETSRAWFDEFTTVWTLDYNKPKVFKAQTATGDAVRLSDIINDLNV